MLFLIPSLFCLVVALIACRHCRTSRHLSDSFPPMPRQFK